MVRSIIRSGIIGAMTVCSVTAAPMTGWKVEDAVQLALENSPALRASALRIRAREAESVQAKVLPNPELELEVENVAGDGPFSGTDAAEYTVFISQSIAMGSKRSRQYRVADAERGLAKWDYESAKRDLVSSVTAAFVQVLEDQERLSLSRELVDLAEQLVQTAERRVKSGGASVLEQAKAEIERASAIANQEQMERHLEASRRQLATLVGVPIATIAPARGDLYQLHELPVFEELEQRLPANPDWARWPAEIEQREAATALANTLRVPDLDLGVGWRRDEDADAHSFIFSAGIPLPIFDRGQGSRQAAHHEQAAAQEERRVAELALERELAGAYGELAEAHARATAIKERILPAANKAFDLSREGYLQGRFGYIDLLDAQRTLFDTRSEYVEVLRIYHQALAVVARLTAGGPDFSQLNTEE